MDNDEQFELIEKNINNNYTICLKNGNFYEMSTNKLIKKNTTKVCGMVDIKSNVIYGYNKKKYPKKKCYIEYGFTPIITTNVPIQQFIYNENIYVMMNYLNKNELTLCEIIGNVGDYETEKKYTKMKCISNWNLNKKYKIELQQEKFINRIDFTKKNTYSIDPLNCEDIDDAIHIEKIKENEYEIGIHIADVSSMIEVNSDLDNEISKRGKTIYLEYETFHMIPNEIMKEMSLIQNKIRNVFSVIFKINSESGEIIDFYYCKSIIKNNKNLSYDDAQKIVDEQINNSHQNDSKEISKDLYNIFIIGKKIYCNLYGNENSFLKQEYDVHKMIEIYMIITNMKVAETITKNYPNNSILRIQNKNDKEKNFLHNYIEKKYYDKFLLLNKNKAIYVIGMIENMKHYDLNLIYYTHFTSPLRRYIDIINHRLLYNIIENTVAGLCGASVQTLHRCPQALLEDMMLASYPPTTVLSEDGGLLANLHPHEALKESIVPAHFHLCSVPHEEALKESVVPAHFHLCSVPHEEALKESVVLAQHSLSTDILKIPNDIPKQNNSLEMNILKIYTNNYLNTCIEYYNILYKWYNYQERYYKNIKQIFDIYKNDNNKKVEGTVLGFAEDEKIYVIVYIPYLDNMYPVIILSSQAKKIIKHKMTLEYFEYLSDLNENFKLKLFDSINVEICVCIKSKKKIYIKLINPNPHIMYSHNECEDAFFI